MEVFINWIGMAATVAFAVTAVLAVTDRDVDLFGAVVLGIITAVGGGTIRDVILDVPIFWALDLTYIWIALAASVASYVARSFFTRHQIYGLMLYLDGLGAALFGIEGTSKVWHLNFGLPAAPIMLGVITAIGGGLIRDVLAGRPTLLMSREIYAIPVLLGCTLFTLVLAYLPDSRILGAVACLTLSFALRAAAIRWGWSVPHWITTKAKPD